MTTNALLASGSSVSSQGLTRLSLRAQKQIRREVVADSESSTTPPHTPAKLAATPWSVNVFTGLFRPARTISIVAASQYEAECTAHSLLADDEWFPVFTAERTPPVRHAPQPRHAHHNVHSARPAVTQSPTNARGLRANEALSATQRYPTPLRNESGAL